VAIFIFKRLKKTYHKDHPDKEYFERFGSFENHITLDYLSGKKLSQGSLPLHYSNKSQTAFACSSMKALISLHKKFNPSKIFDFSGEGVSEDEKSKVEEFYEKVADARKRIMLETAETRNRSILLRSFEQRFDGDEDVYESITQSKLEDERSSFYGMNYTNSNLIHTYCTPILEESRYHKYSKLKSGQDLKLSGFVKLLGLEPKNEDQNIVLGRLLEGIHELGNYRGLADGSSSIDERKFIRNVKRVDEITASAFKKIFTTSDKKEALKYAFIFAALRGYNVRGAMGACWAQEMSLRLVIAQKGWIQFNKMPGTYLDIETCLLGEGNQDEEVEKVINKQVEDYLESIEPTFVPKSTSLFNVPVPLRTNDFDRYLIETQSYQDKDIFRISAYKSDGETALQIAASKGDKRFFSLLNREITQNQSFKKLA